MDPEDVYVVTDRRYGALVRQQLPDVRLIVEPSGRNTAPAIALATEAIPRSDDEVMVVLPADHHIRDEGLFALVLEEAARELAAKSPFDIDGPLVTLGIKPTRPATEYGYIRPRYNEGQRFAGLRAYPVEAFEEKPDRVRAEELFNTGGVAWNAGMFLWQRGAIRRALEKYTGLLTLIAPAVRSEVALRGAYERMKGVSVDYAVLEGASRDGRVVMGSLDVGWTDLGTWGSLVETLGEMAGDGRAAARMLEAGEKVDLGPDDLLLRSAGGQLELLPGPQDTIVAAGPAAVFTDAKTLEPQISSLLDRVQRLEKTA